MPTIEVNLSHLMHNLKIAASYAPQSKILAMVKGNAYGHGIVPVAKSFAEKAGALGVARLEEARTLREANINLPIVIMSGCQSKKEFQQASELDCITVIHSDWQLACLKHLSSMLEVWVKLNTGMNRLGFLVQEASSVYQQLEAMPQIKKKLTWLTHFSDADDPANSKTKHQLEAFQKALEKFPGQKSCANSAAILTLPESHLDWVRPGIMLYGVSPLLGQTGAELNLKSVMTLRSQLITVHELPKHAEIGYGSTWKCPQKTRIGVVAIGYGDGYPRHAKTGTPVLINGRRCQLVGRVSMDMITVDLTNAPKAQVGDEAILWGEDLPVEEVAESADTIAYELLSHILPRRHPVSYW